MYKNHEYIKIANNMASYGGGFVNALGIALKRADDENRKKLSSAFPEYFKTYLNIE